MRTLRPAFSFLFISLYFLASAQYSATSSTAVSYTAGSGNSASTWSNLSYLQNNDNQFAYSYISGTNKYTNEIDAVNWSFQSTSSSQSKFIPSNAIINGIEVTIRLKKSLNGNARSSKVILVKGGREIGLNKATTTSWPASATNFVYGSSVDTWGNTWNASDITNQTFGVRVAARQKGKKDVQAEIDYIKITVYFNQKFFYSKATGNLENPGTWGSSVDGTGTQPINFSSDGQVFFLQNRSVTSLTGDLNVTGTNSKVVVGNGTTSTDFTIPSNYKLTASVELSSNSSLTISNTNVPSITSVGEMTTVTYNATGDQTLSNIPYYNLVIGGSGNKYLPTNASALTVINNVLTVNTGATLNNQGNQVLVLGPTNGMVNNGSAVGSGKYTYEVLDGNTNITGSGTFSNLEINAQLSNNGASVITLGNPTKVTGTLTLSDGLFSNGNNLTMAAGSMVDVIDGTLGSSINPNNVYDVVYAFETATSKTTGGELSGNVRDVTVQIPAGTTLNLGSHVTIGRDLLINRGTLDVTSSNYNVTIGGNFTNNATFVVRSSTFTLNGSGVQTINGAAAQSFYNLTVNNATGGSVALNTPVSVGNVLTLTNGIVTSSSTNLLSLGSSAIITGGSRNSYVAGPLRQTLAATSGTKTFPIGKSGYYKPAVLALNQKTSTATNYTAEVFDGAPPTRTLPSSLAGLSSVRYYTISSSDNANLSSAVVSLTYDLSDQISDYSLLRIAKSHGTEWLNIEGMASSISGEGTITSNAFYSFSDFVLARALPTSTSQSTALPVTWVSFNAVKKQTGIELTWKTANEVNTSYFVVERSSDGSSWKAIGSQTSKGMDANTYVYSDLSPLSVNYYRIKQVDRDGKFEYSKVISIQNKAESKQFAIQPNPVTGSRFNCYIPDAEILSAKEVTVRIFDISGRAIVTTSEAPAMYLPVDCSGFKPGIYLITIQGGNKTQQTKFIKQ